MTPDTKARLDAIDREIAAMTPAQLLAEIRASAGAWSDMEEIKNDHLIQGEDWGFHYILADDDESRISA